MHQLHNTLKTRYTDIPGTDIPGAHARPIDRGGQDPIILDSIDSNL